MKTPFRSFLPSDSLPEDSLPEDSLPSDPVLSDPVLSDPVLSETTLLATLTAVAGKGKGKRRRLPRSVQVKVETQETGEVKVVYTLPDNELENAAQEGRLFWRQQHILSSRLTVSAENLLGQEMVLEQEMLSQQSDLSADYAHLDDILAEYNDPLEETPQHADNLFPQRYLEAYSNHASQGYVSSLGLSTWERIEAALWLLEDTGLKDAWDRQCPEESDTIASNLFAVGYCRHDTPQFEPLWYLLTEEGRAEEKRRQIDAIRKGAQLTYAQAEHALTPLTPETPEVNVLRSKLRDLRRQWSLDNGTTTHAHVESKKARAYWDRAIETLEEEKRQAPIVLDCTGATLTKRRDGSYVLTLPQDKDFNDLPLHQEFIAEFQRRYALQENNAVLPDTNTVIKALESLLAEEEDEHNDLALALANLPNT